ncbi:MAG: stress response translation initiation inhibitor YciH [Promethearchaeota archaeon]
MTIPEDTDICPKCGLPLFACSCRILDQERQRITISLDRRKWGRAMTLVTFQMSDTSNLHDLCTKAKKFCASGGTVKGNTIELQGDHRFKMKKFLIKQGFDKDNIEVMEAPANRGRRR